MGLLARAELCHLHTRQWRSELTCSATIWVRFRIASPEMLPGSDLLPHLICSPPTCIGGGGHGADQHGDTRRVGGCVGRTLRASNRKERGRILDEFAAVSGFHRKHAMRVLRAGQPGRRSGPRPVRRLYNDAMREALIVIWEASDRVCGKRLRPLVPILVEAMERHGHLQLAPEVREGLLAMSAATIDRALREAREPGGGRKRRHAPPSAAIRRSVPVRTFDDWDDPAPGFVEADLVAHSGPTAKGSFVQTLTLTDIATGWTECAPLLVREQKLLTEVLSEMRKLMPFALLGFDTDNDSVFMNETVKTYCEEAGLVFTRCRPYRKNDQAWVEQKNGAVVRHAVGYRRYEGAGGGGGAGAPVCGVAVVRELLPAVLQAGREAARWREGQENISPAGHAVSAAAGGYADQRGSTAPGDGDLRYAGPGSIVANDPRSSTRTRRNRRPSSGGRGDGAYRADAGAVLLGTAHGVAGR